MRSAVKTRRSWQALRSTLLLIFVLMVALPAFSQGCALCYTQAASSGSRMIQALKSGILILIAPPTAMSLVLIGICYRKNNQYRPPADVSESNENW
jgi:ABC-type Fe3+ transport system permease subunit